MNIGARLKNVLNTIGCSLVAGNWVNMVECSQLEQISDNMAKKACAATKAINAGGGCLNASELFQS